MSIINPFAAWQSNIIKMIYFLAVQWTRHPKTSYPPKLISLSLTSASSNLHLVKPKWRTLSLEFATRCKPCWSICRLCFSWVLLVTGVACFKLKYYYTITFLVIGFKIITNKIPNFEFWIVYIAPGSISWINYYSSFHLNDRFLLMFLLPLLLLLIFFFFFFFFCGVGGGGGRERTVVHRFL